MAQRLRSRHRYRAPCIFNVWRLSCRLPFKDSITKYMPRPLLPGKPYPQGATWDGTGVNFAVYSENATGVDLCLFENAGSEPDFVPLRECTGFVWHGYIPGIKIGQLYGYRMQGLYEPLAGQRFNPSKLLIDPYAKAIHGDVDWKAPVFGYKLGDAEEDLSF